MFKVGTETDSTRIPYSLNTYFPLLTLVRNLVYNFDSFLSQGNEKGSGSTIVGLQVATGTSSW